jgi:hypothetical protein
MRCSLYYFSLLAIAGIFLLAGCGAGETSEASSDDETEAVAEKTYTSKNGFVISYPGTWTDKSDIGDAEIAFLDSGGGDDYTGNMTLEFIPTFVKGGDPKNAPALADEALESAKPAGSKELGRKSFQVGSLEAKGVVFETSIDNNGKPFLITQMIVLVMDMAENKGYIFIASEGSDKYATTEPLFENIIKSLKKV